MTVERMKGEEQIADDLVATAADWVARIHSSDANEADFAEWEEWLGANAAHAEAYDAAETVWAMTARLKPTPWPSPEELAAQAAAEFSEPRVKSASVPPRRTRRNVLAIAACVFGLAILGVTLVRLTGPQTLETVTAEQRSVRLFDGSRVTLAPETRLLVARRDDRREVWLERGEAYFEVAHDTARPFIVRAAGHEIIAVGTAFNVDSETDQMTVTVTQGIVRLRAIGAEPQRDALSNVPALELQLGAGERAAADRSGTRRLPAFAKPDEVVAWRDGRLEYLRESLQVVVADVNRYTEKKIVVADPSVAELQFTGTVFLDQLDAWLAALPGTFPVEIVDRGPTRLLQHVGQRPIEVRSAAAPVPVAGDFGSR